MTKQSSAKYTTGTLGKILSSDEKSSLVKQMIPSSEERTVSIRPSLNSESRDEEEDDEGNRFFIEMSKPLLDNES